MTLNTTKSHPTAPVAAPSENTGGRDFVKGVKNQKLPPPIFYWAINTLNKNLPPIFTAQSTPLTKLQHIFDFPIFFQYTPLTKLPSRKEKAQNGGDLSLKVGGI